jgi:hypothetical protein
MASATKLPSLTDIVYFQWATPSAPSPKLSAPIDATGTTITFTSAPLDESGSVVTEAFLMGIRNDAGYVETIYVPAGALSGDGLTATGVVRGIELTGDDWTTGDANNAAIHQQDSPVFCNITAVIQAIMTNAVQGSIATGGDDFIIGTDAAANTVTIYRSTGVGTTAPWIRWNSGGSEVEYSDDGVAWTAINDVSASNLVVVTAADTTPGYLDDKITVSGTDIVKSVLNPGANETLNIDVTVDSTPVDTDYTAEETIAAGAPVSMTSSADEVENAILSTLDVAGTESTFEAGATTYIHSAYVSDNKVAVLYQNASGNQLIIGTVAADKTVTWGTAVQVQAGSGQASAVIRIDDDTIALTAPVGGVQNVYIATIAGTAPTVGAASVVRTAAGALVYADLALVDTDKLVFVYADVNDSNIGKARCATFSGTTISAWGAVETFEAGATKYISIAKFDTDKAGVFYQDDDDTDKGKGVLLVATGTALAAAAAVEFEANVITYTTCDQLTTNKIILCYNETTGTQLDARVASLTGLTISYGVEVTVDTDTANYPSVVATSATEAYVGFDDSGATGLFNKLSVSGTTITVGTQYPYGASGTDVSYSSLAKVSDKSKFIACYRDNGGTNFGNAEVFQDYNNMDAVVGFAQSSVVATDPVTVRSKGTDSNQAGLTIGSDYYIKTGGIELTNNSGVKAGVAGDTTDLDIDIDAVNGMSKADADTLTDGSDASDLHEHTLDIAVGTITKDLSDASATLDVTGLGFTPNYIEFSFGSGAGSGTNSNGCSGCGVYSSSTGNDCVWTGWYNAGAAQGMSASSDNTECVYILGTNGSGGFQEADVSAVASGQFTLNWTKSAAPTGSGFVLWKAFRLSL